MDGCFDLGSQHVGLVAEAGELVVQTSEFLGEVLTVVVHGGGAGVATGVEAPALGLDLGESRHLAEARHVDVDAVREPLLEQRVAAIDRLDVLAAVEADDVGEELDLLGQEVAVRAVDLPVQCAGRR